MSVAVRILILLTLLSPASAQIFGATNYTPSVLSLPSISPPAAVIYSTIKVAGWVGNCATLQRSDNTTQDIGWSNNICDQNAADIFGSDLTIAKIFDQSGNTRDQVQATAANQPTYSNLNNWKGIRPFSFSGITGSTARFTQSSVSVDRGSMTVYMVIAPRVSYSTNSYFELTDAGYTTDYFNLGTAGTPLTMNAGGSVKTSTIYPRAHTQVIAYSSGANGQTLYANGIEQTFASAAPQTSALLTIGKLISNSAYNSLNDVYFFGIWPSQHDADTRAKFIASLNSKFKIQTSFSKRLVYGGSSLVVSWFSSQNQTAPWQGGFGQGVDGWEVYNMGIGGRTMATECSNVATYVGLYDATKTMNRVVMDAPSNDINAQTFADQASAEAYADNLFSTVTVPCNTTLKNAGFNVVVWPTMIGRGSVTTANFQAYAQNRYNFDLNAGASVNGYRSADRASNSLLANSTSTLNNNCYASDRIHLTSYTTVTPLNCYGIMEAIDKAQILN